ncbi:MAG: sulfatase, partial [Myxococcota bacterium]|nr:sulfatase [Myxococcota bacterium]
MQTRAHGPRLLACTVPLALGVLARSLPLALGLLACSAPGPAQPLVLVVVFDAASARYFGAWGDPEGATPHIDRLASEAVVFAQASSQSPTTPPSTASLLTGVRVTTHQMLATSRLDEELATLPELLGAHGFRSYAVVANPLAGAPELGLARGYDEAVLVYGKPGNEEPAGVSEPKGRPGRLAKERGKRPLPTPEQVNDAVEALLPRLHEAPSFLYVHYLQPHEPYDPPEAYRELYDIPDEPSWSELHAEVEKANATRVARPGLVEALEARYRANLRHADAAFGALRERIEDAGLWDGALVVFLSDHGEAFFGHRRFGHNAHLYEDMIHIPFLVRPPTAAGIPPRRLSQPVETIDLLPTILDALGLPVPPQAEGDSLWPLIRGEAKALVGPEVVTSTMSRERHAIRLGRWKYIRGPRDREELFDLAEDPDETRNLVAPDHPHLPPLSAHLQTIIDTPATSTPKPTTLWQDPETRSLLEELGYLEGDAPAKRLNPPNPPPP